MTLVSSTENKPLKFNPRQGAESLKYRMPTNHIGWLHTQTDKPGARFDIVIKDSLGRRKLVKTNCGNDTDKYGELMNIETMIGEELEFSIENLKGAESVEMFVN